MYRYIPIAPGGRIVALAFYKVFQALSRVLFSYLAYVLLFLCKAVTAGVCTAFICIKAYRQVAQYHLASA
jgi:hypothetical protein